MGKTTNSQFSEEREHVIMDLLQQQGRITVAEITETLGISPSTARLQLQKMNDKGMLVRTHGGAVMNGETQTPNNNKNYLNIINKDKKLQIAAAALDTINDGDYISLSSGTTTFLLAAMLHSKKDLTVVTDSIPIAYELAFDEKITLYVCGGWIMHRTTACRGMTAEKFFTDLKVDKSYCGIDSIDVNFGITSVDFDPRTESAVCRSGRECYILADSTKFRVKPYLDKVINLDEISYLISDSSLEQKYIDRLEELGIQVILGSESSQDS